MTDSKRTLCKITIFTVPSLFTTVNGIFSPEILQTPEHSTHDTLRASHDDYDDDSGDDYDDEWGLVGSRSKPVQPSLSTEETSAKETLAKKTPITDAASSLDDHRTSPDASHNEAKESLESAINEEFLNREWYPLDMKCPSERYTHDAHLFSEFVAQDECLSQHIEDTWLIAQGHGEIENEPHPSDKPHHKKLRKQFWSSYANKEIEQQYMELVDWDHSTEDRVRLLVRFKKNLSFMVESCGMSEMGEDEFVMEEVD